MREQSEQHRESSDRNTDWYDGEDEAMLEPIAEPRHDHGEDECCGPRGYGVQLCSNVAVTI